MKVDARKARRHNRQAEHLAFHPNPLLERLKAMQTVPETPTTRKPTAYYAVFHGLSGVIVKPAEAVLFLEPECGAVITLTGPVRTNVSCAANYGHPPQDVTQTFGYSAGNSPGIFMRGGEP